MAEQTTVEGIPSPTLSNPRDLRPLVSVMRAFLEDDRSFCWPGDDNRKGSYYKFSPPTLVSTLFASEGRLSLPKFRSVDGNVQSVWKYSVHPEKQIAMQFDQPFAVKQLSRITSKPEDAGNEVDAMKGLRHPHVVAFLGVFLDSFSCLEHIVMFPAGCCDLGDFLICISKKLELRDRALKHDSQVELVSHESEQLVSHGWPFNLPLEQQLNYVQSYFLCLCQALAYIHASHVRHKDIKLENIIIDASGRVVLVDFGISKHWKNDQQEITRDMIRTCTRRNAPPELANKKVRDRRSDVWALGCVFLDMISVLFGKSHEECQNHCREYNPKTEDYKTAIYENLSHANGWLTTLGQLPFHDPAFDNQVKEKSLPTIRKMLDVNLTQRPFADSLHESFDFAPTKCDDCHPTARTWKPSRVQERIHEETRDKRIEFTRNQDDKDERTLSQIAEGKEAADKTRLYEKTGTGTDRMSALLSLPNRSKSPEHQRNRRLSAARGAISPSEDFGETQSPIHVHPPQDDSGRTILTSLDVMHPVETVAQGSKSNKEVPDEPPPVLKSTSPTLQSTGAPSPEINPPITPDVRPKSRASTKSLQVQNGFLPEKTINTRDTHKKQAHENQQRTSSTADQGRNLKDLRCVDFNVRRKELSMTPLTVQYAKNNLPGPIFFEFEPGYPELSIPMAGGPVVVEVSQQSSGGFFRTWRTLVSTIQSSFGSAPQSYICLHNWDRIEKPKTIAFRMTSPSNVGPTSIIKSRVEF